MTERYTRGLPSDGPVRACPGCGEADPQWLVRLPADRRGGPNRIVCERCGAIFDSQTGAVLFDPDDADELDDPEDHDVPPTQ